MIARCSSGARHIRRLTRPAVVAALVLATPLVVSPVRAADDDGGLRRVVEIEGITEYRLANGLKVLLFPDPSVSTVTVNVTYLVGSRHEGRGEAGMAHLLEHMVFKGTPTYPTIWGALQDHGAAFNGTTWVDRTNYFETLAASHDNLEFALKMEADRMVNSLISGDELAKEMTVVRNEFEIGESSPRRVLRERLLAAAYLWHNYGKSTIGNRSDIERVPVENLREFYRRYYQPDNAMLVVAGNFDPEWALSKIEHYFGALPRPERRLRETYTEEPAQDGPRAVVLHRVGSLAEAGLVYHTPPGSHADVPALEVLTEVLTDRPGGRLYQALVDTDKAVNVSSFNAAWKEPGVVTFHASVRLDQDVVETQRTLIEVVESVAGGISDEEVERARAKLLREINLGMTDSQQVGIVLSEWEALGDWRMMFVQRDRLRKVTTADVNRVAGAYLLESNRTAGMFIPTPEPRRAEIPAAPDLGALLADYRGSESMATGAQFDTTALNIERSTWRGKVGDIELALLPKPTRGEVVHAQLRFRFGTAESVYPYRAAVLLLPELLQRGTEVRDYQALRDELNRIETELAIFGGTSAVTAVIKTTRHNLAAAVALLAEMMKRPSLPAAELEIVRKQQLAQLERMLTDPQGLVFSAVTRALNPYSPDSIHYEPTLDEQITMLGAVTHGEVVEAYRGLLGASYLDVSLVGDFAPNEVKQWLTAAFGDWRSPAPYVHAEREFLPVTAVDQTIDTPDKQMAMVVRGTAFALRDDDPRYAALRFANYLLGQSPKSRLMTALRHQGGLSYGAGSMLQVDDQDEHGMLLAFAMCAPQNVVAAQTKMRDEINRWLTAPLTPSELAEFQQGYEESFRTRLGDDEMIARQLLADLELERPFTFHQELIDAVAKLSPDDIHAAITKVLSDASFVDIKGGDVAKFDAKAEAPAATPGEG